MGRHLWHIIHVFRAIMSRDILTLTVFRTLCVTVTSPI